MNKIEIPLSRTKLTLTIVGAFSFVFFGILFIISPDKFITPFLRSHELVRIVGIISSLIFTILGIYGIKKLFDKNVGLTVDENGITDNTNASSVGLIKWSEIIEIQTQKVLSTKLLLIFTNNPNIYLEKKSGINRRILQGNMKMHGTPIAITSTTLKYSFDDLDNLLVEKLKEQQEKKLNR